tara:strand:+ start:414 stop:596 length:183 start_codon:yes stop_codon:yes gene_type:complete
MRFKKEHKTTIIYKDVFKRYDIELKLIRIRLAYDGEFWFDCIDGDGKVWVLQEHEIQEWK